MAKVDSGFDYAANFGTKAKAKGKAPAASEKNKQPGGAPADMPPEGADTVKPK